MKRPCFLTLKYYQPTPSLGGGGERGGGQIKKPANALHPQPLSLLWGGALHCACPCAPRPQPPAYTKIYPPTTCLGGGPGGGQMRKASHAPRPTHPHLLWGGGSGGGRGGAQAQRLCTSTHGTRFTRETFITCMGLPRSQGGASRNGHTLPQALLVRGILQSKDTRRPWGVSGVL